MESSDHGFDHTNPSALQYFCLLSIAQCAARRTPRGDRNKAGSRSCVRGACAPRSDLSGDIRDTEQGHLQGRRAMRWSRRGSAASFERKVNNVVVKKLGKISGKKSRRRIRNGEVAEEKNAATYKRSCRGSLLGWHVPPLPCGKCCCSS